VNIIDVTNTGVQCEPYPDTGDRRAESVAAVMPETGELFYCGGFDGSGYLSDCYFTTAASKVKYDKKILSKNMKYRYVIK